jgi:hypothetical protein
VLQRDLDLARAKEQAEREAEVLRNLPPPEPEVVPEGNIPSAGTPSAGPANVSGASAFGTQKLGPGGGTFSSGRRQSTISLSSLSRPQFPHKLDLSSDALRINPAELAQGLGGGLPSPVTLAPKSGRTTATSEFPPDFMVALAARPVDIDLTMLPEEGPTAHVSLDPSLGTSADRPIELDLEGMEIDMDVSLFGDEPANDISNPNPFDNTATAAGGNAPSPPSLLEAFDGVTQNSVTSLSFDMAMEGVDNLDFPEFPLDSIMNTSDMGLMDMNPLLHMDSETGTQPEGPNGAGNAWWVFDFLSAPRDTDRNK